MIVWDLRGIAHAVGIRIVDAVLFFLDGAFPPGWSPEDLDIRLERLWPEHALVGGRSAGSAFFTTFRGWLLWMIEENFGLRGTLWDAARWQTVADVVFWIAERVDPVPRTSRLCGVNARRCFCRECPPEGTAREICARTAGVWEKMYFQFGPRRVIPGRWLHEGTPCWCGSGRAYFACCGVDCVPKAAFRESAGGLG